MKLNLIVPVHAKHEKHLLDFYTNTESFFKALPFEYNILLMIDGASRQQRAQWPQIMPSDKLKFHFNNWHLGRAKSIERGLRLADGNLVVITAVDSSVPLAEVVTVLQEQHQSPDWDLLVGNRFSSRKKLQGQRRKWHSVLEDILLEKNRPRFPEVTDCLSSFVAIKKDLLQKILSQKDFDLSSWYYLMPLLKVAKQSGAKIQEVNVQARLSTHSNVPLFREFLRHLT